jgi:hypothetical protein
MSLFVNKFERKKEKSGRFLNVLYWNIQKIDLRMSFLIASETQQNCCNKYQWDYFYFRSIH